MPFKMNLLSHKHNSAPSSAMQASTVKLPAFLSQKHDSIADKFEELEWNERHRMIDGTTDSTRQTFARLAGDHTIARDRYPNVKVFTANRIQLQVPAGGNDYVNASPIRLGDRLWVATQGPTDKTLTHFYRMLLSEIKDIAVVVMLTLPREGMRTKCHEYYPLEELVIELPKDTEAGDGFVGKVELISTEANEELRSEIRQLRVHATTDDGKQYTKDVVHLLYTRWADFATPEAEDRQGLLKLIEYARNINQSTMNSATNGSTTSQDNPTVVHCSAGVGRSGTFIALDYLLEELHAGKFDNIPSSADPVRDTIDLIRQQRMMSVQTADQFLFIYDVLRDQWLAREAAR